MKMFRIGQGYDIHRLIKDRELIIGGVKIPFEKGLLGHSDADVLTHAIIDALFGALSLGDIGEHFPDTDEKFKGADSIFLLSETAKIIKEKGYKAANIDSTIICEKPKLLNYKQKMRENLAAALSIPLDCISVKAKTKEKSDTTGQGLAIEAQAVCLLTSVD